jgi:hypothetical protein
MSDAGFREPFGEVSAPHPTCGGITANYQASEWVRLYHSWEIAMYWTMPGTPEAVELASVNLALSGEGFSPSRQGETWDDVAEDVLRDRAEAWKKLAAL